MKGAPVVDEGGMDGLDGKAPVQSLGEIWSFYGVHGKSDPDPV